MSFTPAVFYKDPMTALAWLEKAFGFETSMLIEPPADDPTNVHAEMSLAGKGRLMVGAEWAAWAKSPASVGGANTANIHVDVESDVNAHCERARQAGAVIQEEPADQFYGARTYRAMDPEGHVWTFAQTIREVSREEAERVSGLKITGWV
ncbi:MAG: VOC family protein [Chloroflexi bacterium]|nr:VOC family protein [Chloroflexota bacterium]